MTKKILIISNSTDLHVDLITETLQRKGHNAFRLNLDCFPRDYQLTQTFNRHGSEGEIKHLLSGSSIQLHEIASIWARKPGDFSFRSDDLGVQEKTYAKLEAEQTLFGLLFGLNCFWIGHPLIMRGAMWKGEQLQRALRFGFQIPNSIISNQPQHIRDFYQAQQASIIFKSMSSASLAADQVEFTDRRTHGITTTLVDEELMENIDAVSELPCHFQKYIHKQYELRVTLIGEHIFAAKIHSQADDRTMIDSRDMSAEIPYEATQLPANIEQQCRDFVSSYGLNFSALDLIVTPENEYVFLENNPAGQFLYIEQLIPEFKLLDTVANLLIKECTCSN
nr:hypothetical protein [uncultured Undibacterium sp.]